MSASPVHLRIAADADINQISELRRVVSCEAYAAYDPDLISPWAAWRHRPDIVRNECLGRPGAFMLAAVNIDQSIVGTGYVHLASHNHGCNAYLGGVYLDPAARRIGLGSRIVTCLLDWLRQHQADRVLIEVANENHPALRMYQSFGFVERNRVFNDRGIPDLFWVEMTLDL